MSFSPIFSEDFNEVISKLKKKDQKMFERIKSKINEILENPTHYKPLGNVLKGCRRVHIGHFVMIFEVNELDETVVFLKFAHHDDAY